jgi:hypothetical protein
MTKQNIVHIDTRGIKNDIKTPYGDITNSVISALGEWGIRYQLIDYGILIYGMEEFADDEDVTIWKGGNRLMFDLSTSKYIRNI